ncbi:putative hydrolase, partial [Paramagnetospirillum caucaseum]
MLSRRDALKTAILATAALAASPAALAGKGGDLMWKHYPADERGFLRSPVLIMGAKEAILVDSSFTLSDGKAIADDIRASGRKLTAIYVSQSDPDYYFGLGPSVAA